ncbi:hypothetical protein [Streptomyces sp. NPDC015350]|uniref:hypothetical protein n=1 Tax=Streptomyces sp. NPDC015350 TaxID=3364955 RepID=UPI0036FC1567
MTHIDRTAPARFKGSGLIAWMTVTTGLAAVFAVVGLGLAGHAEAATAAGVIGGAAFAAGGISVTVNIRR